MADPGLNRHARALSSFEENYAKSTSGGSGIIVYGILLDAAADIDISHVFKATEMVMQKLPLLGAEIVEGNKLGKMWLKMPAYGSREIGAMDQRMWVEEKPWPAALAGDSDHFDGEPGILTLDPAHEDGGALHRAIVQELNTHFVNGDGLPAPPLLPFKVCFYNSAGASVAASPRDHRRRRQIKAVILRLHNAIFDCASARAVASEFAEAIPIVMATISGHPPDMAEPPASANGRLGVPLPIEELLPKSKVSKSFLKKGLDTASYIIKAKNWRILPFHTLPNNSCRPNFRTDLATLGLGKEGTALFFSACKKEGVPWRAALASSFLKTATTIRGPKGEKLDEFSFSCVMDCRRSLEPAITEGTLGNYTLSLLMSAKIKDEKVEFWDLAHNIALSIEKDAQKGKHFSKMPLLNMLFSQVLKYPSMTPNSSCRTMLFSLLMDKPLKESWNVEQTHVIGTIGPLTSLHFIGPCFLLSESLTRDSELLLTLAYPSPLYSRKQILDFLSTSIATIQGSTKQRC